MSKKATKTAKQTAV
jgi:ribosomal protein L12E/L44/L45/RPP1/RPP2